MASNASNNIIYYLLVKTDERNCLGAIRNWSNLKIGFEQDNIWIKGLDFAQVNSLEVKSIPFRTIYYENDGSGRLFLKDSLLPAAPIPSLLWTPIDRGLQVELPAFNHNYFGINQQVPIRLIASEKERDAVAIYTTLENIERYVESAPEIRLQHLRWTIVNEAYAFILGSPLLPIMGKAFWKLDNFLMPVGFDFEFRNLSIYVNELINGDNSNWVIWNDDSGYFKIEKNKLAALSIASFRISSKKLKEANP